MSPVFSIPRDFPSVKEAVSIDTALDCFERLLCLDARDDLTKSTWKLLTFRRPSPVSRIVNLVRSQCRPCWRIPRFWRLRAQVSHQLLSTRARLEKAADFAIDLRYLHQLQGSKVIGTVLFKEDVNMAIIILTSHILHLILHRKWIPKSNQFLLISDHTGRIWLRKRMCSQEHTNYWAIRTTNITGIGIGSSGAKKKTKNKTQTSKPKQAIICIKHR